MRRFSNLVSTVTVLSVILGACNFGETPPPATQVPATQPPATEPPVATEPPTLVSIDLAGPLMEVGSKYLYIDGSILAAVPGGPFPMGFSNFANSREHEVTVSDFWIYTNEVTNQQYDLCLSAEKCTSPDPNDNPVFGNYRFVNYPVVGLNYQQSVDYCTFVHGRLPTEAEWEKAARGPEGNLFPWGDAAPVCDLLNFNFCKGKTDFVKSYPDGVSYYGLFDMSGNVKEWVADFYKPDYDLQAVVDPLVTVLGEKRSVRSSSFSDSADFAFAAHRFSLRPVDHLPDLGFRCVVEDPTFFAPLCTQLAYIGTGPDGSEADCVPDVYCNHVGVSISELPCHVRDPSAFTIVNFSVDPAPYNGFTMPPNAPGCVQLAPPDGLQWQCESGVAGSPASVTGKCYDKASCDPVCPAHYILAGATCKWDGSGTIGTECIAGTTYDPVNQCCAATPGSAVDFSVCPAGQHLFGGVCVADLSSSVDSASAPITFDSCGPPPDQPCDPATNPNGCGGGDDTSTCPPDPSCLYGWDSVKCVCRPG